MVCQSRPRIYWFETAKRWAICAVPLADPRKAEMFAAQLRQQCAAIFNQMIHAWVVDDDQLGGAQQLVTRYYGGFDFIERPQAKQAEPAQSEPPPPPPPPPRPRSRSSVYQVFCALVGCEEAGHLSYARARALYRHAAARLHPDVGGSSDEMAALNVAWLAVRHLLG